MRIYLSQPFAGYTNFSGLLSQFKRFIENQGGWETSDPLDFDITGLTDGQVVQLDVDHVSNCDLILVDLSTPNLGGGVWGELYHAYKLGIPIVVICPDNAWDSPWIRFHSTHRFRTGDTFVEEIFEVCKKLTEKK
jgi:hypothetical protein